MGKAKKDKKLIKFGGGFYCASLPYGEDQIFAFNGFSSCPCVPSSLPRVCPSIITWWTWDFSACVLGGPRVRPVLMGGGCAWEDFRGKVLGPRIQRQLQLILFAARSWRSGRNWGSSRSQTLVTMGLTSQRLRLWLNRACELARLQS